MNMAQNPTSSTPPSIRARQEGKRQAYGAVVGEAYSEVEDKSLAAVFAHACGMFEADPVYAILQEVEHRLSMIGRTLDRSLEHEEAEDERVLTTADLAHEMLMLERRVKALTVLLGHTGYRTPRTPVDEAPESGIDAAAEE